MERRDGRVRERERDRDNPWRPFEGDQDWQAGQPHTTDTLSTLLATVMSGPRRPGGYISGGGGGRALDLHWLAGSVRAACTTAR